MSEHLSTILDELRKPFHPSHITWKPGAVKGERALAMPYADLRAYMNRLDEVCGTDWSVAYEPWGEDRIICRLTIGGVTRSSTGETTNESEKSEIGGTVAEAQAFKRAAAMFGLGRYLYNLPTGWADYDPKTRKFTDKAKARLTGILVQHYRRATDAKTEMAEFFANAEEGESTVIDNQSITVPPEVAALLAEFNVLGQNLYGEQWAQVCQRNVKRISGGKAVESGQLTVEQIQQLINGMSKIRASRKVDTATGEIVEPGVPVQAKSDSGDPVYPARYADLIDKLTGDCLERANRARNFHAQGKGPATPEQYRYLSGVIDDLVGVQKAHNAILEVFVGRAVNGENPPSILLASKLLDALVKEKSEEVDGQKVMVPNPNYSVAAVNCVHTVFRLVQEANGQQSLFEQPAPAADLAK